MVKPAEVKASEPTKKASGTKTMKSVYTKDRLPIEIKRIEAGNDTPKRKDEPKK